MIRTRLRHVPAALAASAALLAVSVGLALWLAGPVPAAGAAAGVGLVSGGYVFSHLCVAIADAVNRTLVLPVGLAVYAGKIVGIGVVMAMLAKARWPGLTAMGSTVIAAVVVWTATQAVWVWRARIPYVEIEPR